MPKYIEFDLVGETGKTEIWNVLSIASGYILGQVRWYGPWRQYCFMPSAQSVFNIKCMDDIKYKINELMDEHRMQKVRNANHRRDETHNRKSQM